MGAEARVFSQVLHGAEDELEQGLSLGIRTCVIDGDTTINNDNLRVRDLRSHMSRIGELTSSEQAQLRA